MLLPREANCSNKGGWYRTTLGLLRVTPIVLLLIVGIPLGVAEEIEVHHSIKTEWPRRGSTKDKERVESESFTFSPDGKILAFKHRYAGLVLWDLEKGKPRFAAGAWKIVVWDPDTGKERIIASFTEGDKRALVWLIEGMAFSPDNKTLVYSTIEGIRFLDVATCQEKGILIARGNSPDKPAIMRDGKTLAWHAGDAIIFWDIHRDQKCLTKIPDASLWFGRKFSITQDGKIGITLPDDSSLALWNIETGKRQALLKPDDNHSYERTVISPDGKNVAAVRLFHGNVDLCNVRTGKWTELPIDGEHSRIDCITFSPDSRMLALLDNNRLLSLWEVSTAKKRAMLPGKMHTPDMQFSPDGRFLAAGANGSIRF